MDRVKLGHIIARLRTEGWHGLAHESMAIFNHADELYFTDVDFPCMIVDLIHRGVLPPDLTPAQVVLIVSIVTAVQDRIANGTVTPLPTPDEFTASNWAEALFGPMAHMEDADLLGAPAPPPVGDGAERTPVPPVYETFLQDLDMEGI